MNKEEIIEALGFTTLIILSVVVIAKFVNVLMALVVVTMLLIGCGWFMFF